MTKFAAKFYSGYVLSRTAAMSSDVQ